VSESMEWVWNPTPEGGYYSGPVTAVLARVRDSRGRSWLLPMVPNPELHPDGHDGEPVELRMLMEMAGPLSAVEFVAVLGRPDE
jgi:hypothetical protein